MLGGYWFLREHAILYISYFIILVSLFNKVLNLKTKYFKTFQYGESFYFFNSSQLLSVKFRVVEVNTIIGKISISRYDFKRSVYTQSDGKISNPNSTHLRHWNPSRSQGFCPPKIVR